MKIFKYNIDVKNQLKEVLRNPQTIFHKLRVVIKLYHQTYSLKPALKQLKKDKELVGAEIGVFRGDNARNILRDLDIKKLYLIDPYTKYYEQSSYDSYDYKTIKKAEKEAKKKLKKYDKKVEWVRDISDKASNEIPNESLDFVYIDGDHSYEQVKKDLKNYTPKVKDGGLVSGHDYKPKESGKVSDAVDEFVNNHNFELHTQETDWWFWK